ncbi:hypothetical protein [Nostoc sp. FACHB-888]|uniref:hypothetical protein n=1 Tax=Nostoc sp. FACHB-888 TaxID=2692842 RepID=UPI001F54FDC7|nr:hypothetical protein [Nostoc sp. FACHB-888]
MLPDSKYIFVSERGEVMSTDAVRKLLGRLAPSQLAPSRVINYHPNNCIAILGS